MSASAVGVTVRLFATLRRHQSPGREGVDHIELPQGTTVEGLIRQLGIEPGAVWVVFVNALRAQPETEVMDGDKVDIFPPVAGGNNGVARIICACAPEELESDD